LMIEVTSVIEVRQRVEEGVVWESLHRPVLLQVILGLHPEDPKEFHLYRRERERGPLSEDERSDDVPVFPKREGDQRPAGPGVAEGVEGALLLRIQGDRLAEVVRKGCRCDEERQTLGSGSSFHMAAYQEFPMIGTVVGSPEETARIDACDLDGDVEQGLEDRFGFKGCPEHVTAFQESVDRPG